MADVAKFNTWLCPYLVSLISGAFTDKINDREVFMKGIDYSYYYEQSE